jgi:hypothetical protein
VFLLGPQAVRSDEFLTGAEWLEPADAAVDSGDDAALPLEALTSRDFVAGAKNTPGRFLEFKQAFGFPERNAPATVTQSLRQQLVITNHGNALKHVLLEWFDTMYEDVAEQGIAFTAIGIVTSDPASVESVLSWASRLQDRVAYLIVENSPAPHADLSYWRDSEPARRFREVFEPLVIAMEYRLPDLENPARQHGVTLGQVAERQTHVEELKKASIVMRAQAYRRRLFTEFERAKELLLP